MRNCLRDEGEWDALDEAEDEAEVHHHPQFLPTHLEEDPVGELRVLLDDPDDHQLDVEQLIDVLGRFRP